MPNFRCVYNGKKSRGYRLYMNMYTYIYINWRDFFRDGSGT